MRLKSSIMRLMLDTNVWLNYFLREEGTHRDCEQLLEAAVTHDTALLVSPTTLKDVFYLIPRRFRRQDALDGKPLVSYAPAAWACLDFMLEIATPSPISFAECTFARSLKARFGDFEDNLLLASAETADVDYIVTYDKPLLKQFPEVFVTPKRALELLNMQEQSV